MMADAVACKSHVNFEEMVQSVVQRDLAPTNEEINEIKSFLRRTRRKKLFNLRGHYFLCSDEIKSVRKEPASHATLLTVGYCLSLILFKEERM